jgi:hypothetical protein
LSIFDKLQGNAEKYVIKKLTNSKFGSILTQISQGFASVDNVKDYSHASKLMRSNNFALAPKQKFLFHVYFTMNVPGVAPDDAGVIGALVKSVQLPSFNLDTKEYVQYNRKRLVHNRIEYQPVTIKLHDDASDIIRTMWAKYYQYYFADSAYQYENGPTTAGRANYNERDLYDSARINQQKGWGITAEGSGSDTKPAFFKDITIYGMSNGNFFSYTLINPVIQSWRHDSYDYEQSAGIMEHEMQIKYEAVKYGSGQIGEDGINVKGFANPSRYDNIPGALGPGKSATTFGPGGAIDTVTSFVEDLSSGDWLGAARTAAKANTSYKGKDFGEMIKDDIARKTKDQATKMVKAKLQKPKGAFSYPTPKTGVNATPTPSTLSTDTPFSG